MQAGSDQPLQHLAREAATATAPAAVEIGARRAHHADVEVPAILPREVDMRANRRLREPVKVPSRAENPASARVVKVASASTVVLSGDRWALKAVC